MGSASEPSTEYVFDEALSFTSGSSNENIHVALRQAYMIIAATTEYFTHSASGGSWLRPSSWAALARLAESLCQEPKLLQSLWPTRIICTNAIDHACIKPSGKIIWW